MVANLHALEKPSRGYNADRENRKVLAAIAALPDNLLFALWSAVQPDRSPYGAFVAEALDYELMEIRRPLSE